MWPGSRRRPPGSPDEAMAVTKLGGGGGAGCQAQPAVSAEALRSYPRAGKKSCGTRRPARTALLFSSPGALNSEPNCKPGSHATQSKKSGGSGILIQHRGCVRLMVAQVNERTFLPLLPDLTATPPACVCQATCSKTSHFLTCNENHPKHPFPRYPSGRVAQLDCG